MRLPYNSQRVTASKPSFVDGIRPAYCLCDSLSPFRGEDEGEGTRLFRLAKLRFDG
jgi:hypothetical protein